MLQYNRQVNLFTAMIYKGSALSSIWPHLTLNFIVSALATAAFMKGGIPLSESLSLTPFSLIGLALSIFLGFRNNACYDRFWEGRKLWGSLVNTSRTLTRQMLTLIGPGGGEVEITADDNEIKSFQHRMVYHVMAYVHALRHHLRDTEPYADLERFLPKEEVARLRIERNVPVAIIQTMADELAAGWRGGWIHSFHLPSLEAQLTSLTNIQGGCERIKATPIPMSYTLLTHRIVGVYTFTLPFALVSSTGWMTPFASLLVAYAFFGLDAIGGQIEAPFDTDPNDLPLSALSTTIEIGLRQRLGETDLPANPAPVDHILS